jgi:uncharacterized protein DUF6353
MNLDLTKFQSGLSQGFGRSGFLLRKHSPEILLGLGIIGGITAAVMAAKATLKVNDVLAETERTLGVIQRAENGGKTAGQQGYSHEDANKDRAVVYVQTGLQFAKLYGPSVGLGVLSVTSILAAHGIMARRQVALVAAYNILNEGFRSYRRRVVEELGEETDRNYHLGLREEDVIENTVDDKGKKKSTRKKGLAHDPEHYSEYSVLFDEASTQWTNDPTLNRYFLQAQQNHANDILISRGHLFLNEVYDMLGVPRTKAGSVVGWVLKSPQKMKEEGRDGYVDFDMFNENSPATRDFVNGFNPSIILDFNVDGIIYDLI